MLATNPAPMLSRKPHPQHHRRLPHQIREADVLRVDFPGGEMRWVVSHITDGVVHVKSIINNTPSKIDIDYLTYLLKHDSVRRETPMELMGAQTRPKES